MKQETRANFSALFSVQLPLSKRSCKIIPSSRPRRQHEFSPRNVFPLSTPTKTKEKDEKQKVARGSIPCFLSFKIKNLESILDLFFFQIFLNYLLFFYWMRKFGYVFLFSFSLFLFFFFFHDKRLISEYNFLMKSCFTHFQLINQSS